MFALLLTKIFQKYASMNLTCPKFRESFMGITILLLFPRSLGILDASIRQNIANIRQFVVHLADLIV